MSPCKTCPAKCCKYFAFQIDTPRSKKDFETVRWYLAHKGVEVFVDKKAWYLDINNKCTHLTEKNLCDIYENRPAICREHSNIDCETHEGDFAHDMVFKNIHQLDKFIKKRFERKKRP